MTSEELKQILKNSKITISEIADIFQMTRQTLYRWLRGVKPRQKIAYQVVTSYFMRLQKAIERGDLPLSKDIKRSERKAVIKELLKR
jgi:transcriptional regulator with XRE-family HTH domain